MSMSWGTWKNDPSRCQLTNIRFSSPCAWSRQTTSSTPPPPPPCQSWLNPIFLQSLDLVAGKREHAPPIPITLQATAQAAAKFSSEHQKEPLQFWPLTLPMCWLLSSKAQGCKDLWKSSKPYHVGIHRKPLAEYSQMSTHMPGFQ